MFTQTVRSVMQRQKLVKAPSTTTVARAAKLMSAKNAGAVLVVDDGRLVGIFTERDVVFRVVAPGLDADATLLSSVMTRRPRTIAPGKPFGAALALMHEHGFRHLPVVEEGRIVGIVSARSAMDPELEEFESEAQRRRSYLAQV